MCYLDEGQGVPYDLWPGRARARGVFELGVGFKPVADSGFSFDLAARGYAGTRRGLSDSLQLKF